MSDHEIDKKILQNLEARNAKKKYSICKLYGLYCLQTRGRGGIKPI